MNPGLLAPALKTLSTASRGGASSHKGYHSKGRVQGEKSSALKMSLKLPVTYNMVAYCHHPSSARSRGAPVRMGGLSSGAVTHDKIRICHRPHISLCGYHWIHISTIHVRWDRPRLTLFRILKLFANNNSIIFLVTNGPCISPCLEEAHLSMSTLRGRKAV